MVPEIALPPEYRRKGSGGELYSEIAIRSTPERIWEILADFSRYPEWNPFIRSIRGDLVPGGNITAELRPPGSAGMTIRPVLVKVDPPQELRWKGHLLITGLFDGEHVFEIRPLDNQSSLFIQREIFSGILLPLFETMLKGGTARGFAEMNKALKEQAEGTVAA
ncbi:SRPBCC domain-containing protein [Methanoregula sp.]|uniref:SRPBCC domain-containing protein n=1 Tax=Methanoregula sp. TaxID=2052170 RepID=UPI000CC9B464|nr:SRPBCC domain-containing protein [Methanoregula sp.]PKG32839.1 MAG: SRPBCC domain-containing protein [Methanoregula sp.]